MTYLQEITLDLNANTAPPIIYAKQNDTDSRALLVHFTQDDAEYLIDHNNSVALRVRKPDGTQIMDETTVNNDGTVTVTFSQQCLAADGRAYADLAEFNSLGQLLSTASFIINIVASPDVMGSRALSSDEFTYLTSFIQRGNEIIGEAQEWANGYNGDVPVSSTNPAYNNNAKYWSDHAKEIADNLSVEAGNPVDPGKAPTSRKVEAGDTIKYILGLPSVKPHATSTTRIAEAGEAPSASVSVSDYSGAIPSDEEQNLQKSFDFSFVLPSGVPGPGGGFSNVTTVQVNTLNPGASATASVDVLDSPDTAKQFKFSFGIPQGATGATGAAGRDGATGATGAQGPQGPAGRSVSEVTVPSANTLNIIYSDGTSQQITGYSGASAVSSISFSNDDGDLIISVVST